MERIGNYEIAVFEGQVAAADQVRSWLEQGKRNNDLYVLADSREQLAVFGEFPGIHVSTDAGGDWMDGFKSMFSANATMKEAFLQMGFEPEQAQLYYDEIKNGNIVLLADTSAAPDIPPKAPVADTGEQRMALHEEQLTAEKKRVQTGELNVRKSVVEEQQQIDVPVQREEIIVDRITVEHGELGSAASHGPRTEPYQVGDEWHIPIVEEKIIVTKKRVVKEELVIKKRIVDGVERITETVRREVPEIEEEFFDDKL